MARKVHDSGLTIREYLWKHYTMVDPVTGEALATPTPTPTATPSPTLVPTPSATAGNPTPSASGTGPAVVPGKPIDRGLDPLIVVGGTAAVVVLGALAAVAVRRRGSPA